MIHTNRYNTTDTEILSEHEQLKPDLEAVYGIDTQTQKVLFSTKPLKIGIAAFFLLLLITGMTIAMHLAQTSQDVRNQAQVIYGACPTGVGGTADQLSCENLPEPECSEYASCHLGSGYTPSNQLPGTNTCLYTDSRGGKCTAHCPDSMENDYKKCQCNNGVWTIGTGASCDQLCKCTGNYIVITPTPAPIETVCIEQCPGIDNVLRNCHPPESDGTSQDSLCNLAGRIEACGKYTFCCPKAGDKWTKDTTKCQSSAMTR